MKETRINKYLSEVGYCSRRAADKLIEQGRVTINGEVPLMGTKIVEGDKVCVDGKAVSKSEEAAVYIALNKPTGIVCTTDTRVEKDNIIDYLNYPKRIFPIGRLDKASEGLILLTNDGDLHHYLTHPSHMVAKDYEAIIEGKISDNQRKKLKRGIYIGYKEYGKAEVIKQETLKGRSNVQLRLRQGKKREIRRIFFRLKIKLLSLIL